MVDETVGVCYTEQVLIFTVRVQGYISTELSPISISDLIYMFKVVVIWSCLRVINCFMTKGDLVIMHLWQILVMFAYVDELASCVIKLSSML